MQRYQDSILNSAGQPVSGATVLVRPTGSTATATIYGTNTGTATAANPVTTDVNGRFGFYGTNGRYDLVVSGSYIQTTTVTDVMLEDVPLTNLAELTTASSARDNLGLGSAAVVSTATFVKAANNLSDLLSTASARINLGMGTSTGTVLSASRNLGDLASAATARVNLLLGTSTGTVLSASRNLGDVETPATARANLGVAIGTNVQAFSTAYALTTGSQTFTGGRRNTQVVLASTGQITPDFSAANNFQLSMTVNTTLAAGTGGAVGQEGRIVIFQNSTAKTLAYDSAFYKLVGATTATLSTATAVGTTDVLRYYIMTTTSAECEMRNLVS